MSGKAPQQVNVNELQTQFRDLQKTTSLPAGPGAVRLGLAYKGRPFRGTVTASVTGYTRYSEFKNAAQGTGFPISALD